MSNDAVLHRSLAVLRQGLFTPKKRLCMYKPILFCCCLITFSCNVQQEKENKLNTGKTAFTEGKGYPVVKRFCIADEQELNQPIQAFSFVLPAECKVEGKIVRNTS